MKLRHVGNMIWHLEEPIPPRQATAEEKLLLAEISSLRAQHEQLTAFSLLQKECIIAAEEMYGTCLGAYPNSGETARTEACRKFLQLNDAVGRHPLDDKFLGMTDWKDTAASLRGLVGRICETVSEIGWCSICGRTDCGKNPLVHKPDCLISEAEAAIKEPHNGENVKA